MNVVLRISTPCVVKLKNITTEQAKELEKQLGVPYDTSDTWGFDKEYTFSGNKTTIEDCKEREKKRRKKDIFKILTIGISVILIVLLGKLSYEVYDNLSVKKMTMRELEVEMYENPFVKELYAEVEVRIVQVKADTTYYSIYDDKVLVVEDVNTKVGRTSYEVLVDHKDSGKFKKLKVGSVVRLRIATSQSYGKKYYAKKMLTR